jgi:hypothetical protein
MQQSRFRYDHLRKSGTCYDCRQPLLEGAQFAWDNLRNIRICLLCVDSLKEIVGEPNGSVSDQPTKKKVYWDKSMLPTRPWHIGNYDINSWPAHIQREYIHMSSSEAAYKQGLKAARARLSYGTENCAQCEEEDKLKQEWKPEHGNITDWIEQIYAQTDFEACRALWLVINNVKWPPEQMIRLGKAYTQHLASLTSMETWGLPFTGMKALSNRV